MLEGGGSYGQGHGQLELELGSNGGSREKEGIREEGKNRGEEWIGEALGSLSRRRQREPAARQARRCVAAPEGAAATSCCLLARGRGRAGRWAGPGLGDR